MSTTVIAKNGADTYISDSRGATNFGQAARLKCNNGTPKNRSYLHVPFNVPRGYRSLVQADLHLFTVGSGWTVARNLTIKACTTGWRENRLTYNRAPNVTAAYFNASVGSGTGAGEEIVIDLLSLFNDVLGDTIFWFGIELSTTASAEVFFASFDNPDLTQRPYVEFTWDKASPTPTNLRPNGTYVAATKPVLSWDWGIDDLDQTAYQIQVDNNADFGSPLYDSGQVNGSGRSHDSGSNLVSGTLYYWRVRTFAGAWSEWSEAATVTFTGNGTVTISSPPSPLVSFSPVVAWSYTRTQTMYQVLVYENGKKRYDSGVVTSTDTSMEIPDGIIKKWTSSWKFTVRLWDNLTRESVPGSPAYSSASVTRTFARSGSVPAVLTLTATEDAGGGLLLHFTRATQPDAWAISVAVDGGARQTRMVVDMSDVTVINATTFEYRWFGATPRHSNVIEVLAGDIVSGERKYSASNPTATITPNPKGVWLASLDGTLVVQVMDDQSMSLQQTDDRVEFSVVGRADVVTVMSTFQGYEGVITGTITTATAKATLEALAAASVTEDVWVIAGEDAFRARLGSYSVKPELGIYYSVNIPFRQVQNILEPV